MSADCDVINEASDVSAAVSYPAAASSCRHQPREDGDLRNVSAGSSQRRHGCEGNIVTTKAPESSADNSRPENNVQHSKTVGRDLFASKVNLVSFSLS